MPIQNRVAVRAALADRTLNPTRNVPAALPAGQHGSGGQVTQFNIVYEGVNFNPEDVFDALETKYGSGKVIADTDQLARSGPFNLRITT